MIMMLVAGPNAVIALSGNLSGAIDLGDGGLVALQMPSGWDTGGLSFQASSDLGGTYADVYTSTSLGVSTELTIGAAASEYIALNASVFAGMRYIKIRSGTTGSPVTQTAARTIKTMVRRLG
jgi:hypothetical protein